MEKYNISLKINNLFVSVLDKPVLKDICLSVVSGTVHAIMGPNGAGKSSLAYAFAGHPSYVITSGSIVLHEHNLLECAPHERARRGFFLAFQNPPEIPGVSVFSFLKEAYAAVKNIQIAVEDFKIMLKKRCTQLAIDESFLLRGLNEGFSGGEKKRFELLQLLILQPHIAILDEIDSGLDIDALKTVAIGIEIARQENPLLTIILITHYRRILDYICPDYVHVLCDGRIVASGDATLSHTLELEGYDAFKQQE
jgi:Fe-S cluster assembly ATP-binding protein